MRVMLLSPYPDALLPIFDDAGDAVCVAREEGEEVPWHADYVVSYGWPHIIRGQFLDRYQGRMCNLHIGCLPWNRGAHPNFWSWFEDTPKGATIHEIDAGVDTGPIITRSVVSMSAEHETLATSYNFLHRTIVDLFKNHWPYIRVKNYSTHVMRTPGTFHKKKDLEPIWPMLPKGWDTLCKDVEFLGHEYRANNLV